MKFNRKYFRNCRSQWPRGLRRRSVAARLLRSWFWNPPGAWTFVGSVVRQRSLRRANHSSRGVLPTVMRHCVWSRNLVNEEALANWGLSRPKQTAERKTYNRTNRTSDFPYHAAAAVIRAHPSDPRQKKGTAAGRHEDQSIKKAIQIRYKHCKAYEPVNRYSFNLIYSHFPLRWIIAFLITRVVTHRTSAASGLP